MLITGGKRLDWTVNRFHQNENAEFEWVPGALVRSQQLSLVQETFGVDFY